MSIAKATRRIRNTRGSSYLTKGADDYDHHGFNKAQRQLSAALIEEALEETEVEKEARWMWVLQAYLIDGDKFWLDGWDVVGVYSTLEELQSRVNQFEDTQLDWDYINIDGDSNLAYEARFHHDPF